MMKITLECCVVVYGTGNGANACLLPLFWELLTSNLVSEFLSGKKILIIYLVEELE
jgi:hypothetical protein